jgi:type I site-specific restriction endonuclease
VNGDFWSSVGSTTYANEADVETRLVLPLLDELGYERQNVGSKVPVLFQEGRASRPGRKPEADFVVYAEEPHGRATSLLVVETKHPNEPLDGGRDQAESYAQNLRAPLFLMTNGRHLQIWQSHITTESRCLLECAVQDIPNVRAQVESLLTKAAAKALCGTIEYKRFDVLADDTTVYERSEFERSALTCPRRSGPAPM